MQDFKDMVKFYLATESVPACSGYALREVLELAAPRSKVGAARSLEILHRQNINFTHLTLQISHHGLNKQNASCTLVQQNPDFSLLAPKRVGIDLQAYFPR